MAMWLTQQVCINGGIGKLDQLVDGLLIPPSARPGFPKAQVDACLQSGEDDRMFEAEAPGTLIGCLHPGEQSTCCSVHLQAFYFVVAKCLRVHCIKGGMTSWARFGISHL